MTIFRRFELILGFLLGVAVSAVVVTINYQNAEHNQQSYRGTGDAGIKQEPSREPFWIRATDDPTALFTGVVAIFTVVLAGSTIGLWVVTWRASLRQSQDMQASVAVATQTARAAELSARAIVRIELPIVKFYAPDLRALDEPLPLEGAYGFTEQIGVPGKYSGITDVTAMNYGRTPAFPEMMDYGWVVVWTLPEVPRYRSSIPSPQKDIVDSDGGKWICEFKCTIELTDEQREQIRTKKAWLWFYVRLHYRDFLNERHVSAMAWRWEDLGDGSFYFASDGFPGPAYEHYT